MALVISEINISNLKNDIKFGDIKSLDNGGKVIPVYYKGNPLTIQTPQCYAPFGINVFKNDKVESHSMDLSFKDKEKRPSLMKFYKFYQELDKIIINACMANHQTWFKKKEQKKDVVEALYTSLIKFSKDKDTGEITDKYPPTFKLKVPCKNDKYLVSCYNENGEKYENLNTVDTKGAKIITIIRCNGIWIAGGKFGCSFKTIQMEIIPRITFINTCLITKSDDDMIEN